MLYIWYPKNQTDLNVIHEENDIIVTPEELVNVKNKLKQGTVRLEKKKLLECILTGNSKFYLGKVYAEE